MAFTEYIVANTDDHFFANMRDLVGTCNRGNNIIENGVNISAFRKSLVAV